MFFMHAEICPLIKYKIVSLLSLPPPCFEGITARERRRTLSLVYPNAILGPSKGSWPFPAASRAMFRRGKDKSLGSVKYKGREK